MPNRLNRSTSPPNAPRSPRRAAPRWRRLPEERPRQILHAALEVFDDESQQARPAAIFTDRVIDPPTERLGVDTPDEAVAVCLDESGAVTLERVAELLGTDEATARTQLGELVYEDPAGGSLIPSAQYLSGNIRHKIDACVEATGERPDLAVNLAALLEQAFAQSPRLRAYVLDDQGGLRENVAAFIDGRRSLDVKALLQPHSRVFVLQALSGG